MNDQTNFRFYADAFEIIKGKNDKGEEVYNKVIDLSFRNTEKYTEADCFSPDLAGDYTVMVTVQDELGNETSSDPIQITYK